MPLKKATSSPKSSASHEMKRLLACGEEGRFSDNDGIQTTGDLISLSFPRCSSLKLDFFSPKTSNGTLSHFPNDFKTGWQKLPWRKGANIPLQSILHLVMGSFGSNWQFSRLVICLTIPLHYTTILRSGPFPNEILPAIAISQKKTTMFPRTLWCS